MSDPVNPQTLQFLKNKDIFFFIAHDDNIINAEVLAYNDDLTAQFKYPLYIVNGKDKPIDLNFTVNFLVGSKTCGYEIVGKTYQKSEMTDPFIFLVNLKDSPKDPQTLTITLPSQFMIHCKVVPQSDIRQFDGQMKIKINYFRENKGAIPAFVPNSDPRPAIPGKLIPIPSSPIPAKLVPIPSSPLPAKLGPIPVKLGPIPEKINFISEKNIIYAVVIFTIIFLFVRFILDNVRNNNLST